MGGAAMYEDFDDPVLFGPAQLVTSSKLGRSVGAYIDKAQKRPIFVSRDNEVEAVLINIDDYRTFLMEGQKVDELFLVVKSIRRMLENMNINGPLIDMDDVMKSFGVSRDSLAEAPEDVMED